MKITTLQNSFQELNQYIEEAKPSQLFFLTDENTHNCCLPKLLSELQTDIPFEILEIEPGEEMKTIETATQLWSILSEFEADRKALMINLGGGVITDLGGFVASTYKRGIRFINVPTSLLAMCDAAIGGKTAIDHGFLKNIVGTFAPPEHTFLCTGFLNTLPFEELRSGFAEMLKHGLIANKTHWQSLSSIEELTVAAVDPHIWVSAMIKEDIVHQDFKEQNIRKTLNFGHTIGHAVESLFMQSSRPVPHGEAVALGMICETKISESEGLLTSADAQIITDTLRRFYPKLDISGFSSSDIFALMRNDKKNFNGGIRFSLLTAIGQSNFDYIASEKNISEAIDYYRAL